MFPKRAFEIYSAAGCVSGFVVGVREVAVERMVMRDECGSGSGEREYGRIE